MLQKFLGSCLVLVFLCASLVQAQLTIAAFDDIARNHFPDYAGHYYDDENDRIVILMKNYQAEDLSGQSLSPSEDEIEKVWREEFPPLASRRPALSTQAEQQEIVILSADYSYLELIEWTEKITQDFFIPKGLRGGLSIYWDENKISVDIESLDPKYPETLREELDIYLEENNIPKEAVGISRVITTLGRNFPPPSPCAQGLTKTACSIPPPDENANHYIRPFMMNLEIEAEERYGSKDSGKCSIGFFAKAWRGSRSYGFVTAYHCIGQEKALSKKLSQPLEWFQDGNNRDFKKIGYSYSSSEPKQSTDVYFVKLSDTDYRKNEFPWFSTAETYKYTSNSSNGVYSSTKKVSGVLRENRLLSVTQSFVLPSRRNGRISGSRISTLASTYNPFLPDFKARNLFCFLTKIPSHLMKGASGSAIMFNSYGSWYIAGIFVIGRYDFNRKTDRVCFHSVDQAEKALGVHIQY